MKRCNKILSSKESQNKNSASDKNNIFFLNDLHLTKNCESGGGGVVIKSLMLK